MDQSCIRLDLDNAAGFTAAGSNSRRRRNRQIVSFLGAALTTFLIAGCGGAGTTQPGVTSGNGTLTSTLGDAKLEYTGHPMKLEAAALGTTVTVAGMAGASFSSIELMPQPILENSSIIYGNPSSALMAISNGTTSELVESLYGANLPSASPDGRIAVTTLNPQFDTYLTIATCNPDGSNFQALQPSGGVLNVLTDPAWSPDGTRIACDDGTNIWLYQVTGSSAGAFTKLFPGIQPAWDPTGKYLLFSAPGSSNANQIFVRPASTTGSNILVSAHNQGCYSPAWSPDGKSIAYAVGSSLTTTNLVVADGSTLPANNYSTFNQTSIGAGAYPAFSPDSRSLLTTKFNSSGQASLVQTDLLGQNPVTVAQAVNSTAGRGCWTPFMPNRKFVGGSAIGTQTAPYFPSAAGFLLTQNGTRFASFVAFTATTPSAATITTVSSGGSGGAIVEDLHADAINALSYSNSYYLAGAKIAMGGVTDVLVSVDSNTGAVGTMAPFVAHAGTRTRALTGTKGVLVYRGQFTGVFNAKDAKNAAPGGAQEIGIDEATGKLVYAR